MKSFERIKSILLEENSLSNWNTSSGVTVEEIEIVCSQIEKQYNSRQLINAKQIEYILKNAQIEVNPYSIFADKINHGDVMRDFALAQIDKIVANEMKETLSIYHNSQKGEVFWAGIDLGHTCPNWKFLLDNGFAGIAKIADEKLHCNELSQEQVNFYNAVKIVYSAACEYAKRLANEVHSLITENALLSITEYALNNISASAPKTFFEAMQFILLYYVIQYDLDHTAVRSLGGLDSLLYPYYEKDIKDGLITEEDARLYLRYFMCKLYAKKHEANIPFYLGGQDENGKDLTNSLSYMILEEYEALDIHDPKMHIKYNNRTPEKLLRKVLDLIRKGKNSFVFMNDEVIIKGLMKLGVPKEDAKHYGIVGCYEPFVENKEIPCSCAGKINLPKIVNLAISDGYDDMFDKRIFAPQNLEIKTFDDFMERVKLNIKLIADGAMTIVNGFEKYYDVINPSPAISGSMPECLDKGVDAYNGGVKYGNTSINAFGLANVVDSLMIIKKYVFEEKIIGLEDLRTALKSNWKGYEELHLKCKGFTQRYGNNISEPDAIMLELTEYLSNCINNKPNGRGGVYRLGLFSIDWRIPFGEKTWATPDGRFAREALSKNMSPIIGYDNKGLTSLINSVTKIDYTNVPNGTVLDLSIHETAVNGEDGVDILLGILRTYFKKGGNTVHINVLNADTLKKAQKNPEKYKNLQVRLCGWNVYFVNLNQIEQDDFIKQAEHIG